MPADPGNSAAELLRHWIDECREACFAARCYVFATRDDDEGLALFDAVGEAGDACVLLLSVLERDLATRVAAAATCADACEGCAKACEPYEGEAALAACASSCRRCADACRTLVRALLTARGSLPDEDSDAPAA